MYRVPNYTPTAAGGGAGFLSGFPFMGLLASFAPALLSKLFGFDPQRDLRRKVSDLQSAANVGKITSQFYQQNLASPGYGQAQGQIAAGANATSGQLANALSARGLGTSGSAAILNSLVPSITGQQEAGLRTSAYNSAQDQAMRQIQQQIATLMGTSGPSATQQFLGGGLESFGPFLTQWLKQRYPGMGAPT